MAEEQAAHHLLNVLEERGLDVDLDKILLGFEDEQIKQEAAQWVEEYLHQDTLLSKEELELYQILSKKNQLHQYTTEDEPIRPILDDEVASAIESLQSSTVAIAEQCRVLEAQKDALAKLKVLDKVNLDAEHMRNERRRKESQEKGRLDVAMDDMSTSLAEQLAETQKEIDSEKATIQSYLAERFSSDDQILTRLPGIVAQIVTESKASQDEISIEQWCKAIVAFRTAEIKARVDTVYLNSITSYKPEDSIHDSKRDLPEEKIALQAEMETLHQEIASVAEMVIEHEIRQPMVDVRDRRDREKTQARAAWLRYVLSTLEYMSRRVDTIADISAETNEFQQALAHVHRAATERMSANHAVVPTSVFRRMTSGTSAFTPMIKLKPTRSLEIPVALQDALRHAGVAYKQDSIASLQDSVISAQLQRQKKLLDHYASASASAHDDIAERLFRADRDFRDMSSVLYKHTAFHSVSLSSPQLKEQLGYMEQQLDHKDRELMEAEGSELDLNHPKVRAFIATYGK
ncbi:hypothetical protein ACN47E_009012 [Coniothyrium glycines]